MAEEPTAETNIEEKGEKAADEKAKDAAVKEPAGEQGSDTEEENAFVTKISNNDITGVVNDLKLGLASVNWQDAHGMTALMHAAYRGSKEMCEILIDHGAEVNGGTHNNGYTPLHFGGLSGSAGVCQLLLQKGANPLARNSVKRTPVQMAAFVGNHNCVSTINSYVDRKDVEYFATCQGQETTPKLPQLCVSSLYNLILQPNFHPVRVALSVKKNTILLTNMESIIKVLDLMAEREMKKGLETNEISAFKMHCISQTLQFILLETADAPRDKDPVDVFIQKLLKCDKAGDIPEGLDQQLRKCVRAFPFHKSTIMQQLVGNLVQITVGQQPGAWSVIRSVVNGHKGFQDNDPCAACGEEHGVKKCSRCHYDAYCNGECQKTHWFVHKKYCKKMAQEYAKRQASQPPPLDNFVIE